MVDYSKLSDAEIAQKVFFWVNDKICLAGGLAHFFNGEFLYSSKGQSSKKFDPCNNPEDAWPIITNNFISVIPSAHRDIWFADGQGGETTFDTNPLRAAMIVFLMMKDAKNG